MKALTLCSVLFFLFATSVFADTTLVRFGSVWKYLDDGSTPANTWKGGAAFNDDQWKSGPAAFGYGSAYLRTNLNFGPDPNAKFTTNYFRKTFTIANVADYSVFRLSYYLDQGFVVYINGREVTRVNLPQGPIESYVPATFSSENGNVVNAQTIRSSFFKTGTNEIAVELHQGNRKNRSMVLDLELTGVAGSNSAEVVRGPFLQMVHTTGITIKWKTNIPTSSAVRYGTSESTLSQVSANQAMVVDHEVTLKGLQPDTRYFYSIGTAAYPSKGNYRLTFSTAPLATTSRKIRIGVIGDAGTGDVNQKRSRNRYLETYPKGTEPDLAIMLGDNAYPLGTDKDYQGGFFSIYNDNLFNNHPVFSVPGNHEYAGVAGVSDIAYYNIFSLPQSGECGGVASGTESYYSFDYGNIHFVMLNSYGYDGGKQLIDTLGKQAEWLKKDLAANAGKSKWTVACFHHPPYSNANHYSDGEADLTAMRERITPILERFGVDLVLAGHSHGYERSYMIQGHTGKSGSFQAQRPPLGNLVSGSNGRYDGSDNSCPYLIQDTAAPHGTMYVVAGAAGQQGGGNNPKWPLFAYRTYSATPGTECGILSLEIQNNRLDGKYIGSNTGSILDKFTIIKGAGKKQTLVAETNTPVKLTASYPGNYFWTPTQSVIKNESKSITFTPVTSESFTYFVRDNENPALACITDTFVIRTYAALLPANTEFTAAPKMNAVELKWTTSQEISVVNYILERSANGTDYTQIATVFANSGSTQGANYTYNDRTVLSGKNYYRLIAVSLSGARKELGVRQISFEASYSLTVTPRINPSPQNNVELMIHNMRRQELDLSIVNMLGMKVYSRQFTVSEGLQTITLKLQPGTYVISGRTMDGVVASGQLVVN
jgi:Icc-related predicted phosphoesterase